MNNNRTDESALLGVFSKASYITFGEGEKPLPYNQKVRLSSSRLQGTRGKAIEFPLASSLPASSMDMRLQSFSPSMFLGIRQKYNSLLYPSSFPWAPPQMNDRSNFRSKQLMTTRLKEGKTNDVFFEKKHNWIADGDKFKDRLMYQDQQKEKKKGFLSGDFKRRDEFSMMFRMEQYREQLKRVRHSGQSGLSC